MRDSAFVAVDASARLYRELSMGPLDLETAKRGNADDSSFAVLFRPQAIRWWYSSEGVRAPRRTTLDPRCN